MAQHKPKIAEKPCKHCGAIIVWTRNTSTIWNNVLYCDNACKRQANRLQPVIIQPGANLKGPARAKKR